MTCTQADGGCGHRVRRSLSIVALAVVVTAATAMPAAAGGWWTYPQLEHHELAIGESVTVTADVLFPATEDAEQATGSGEYHAYLVRGIDEAALKDAMSVAQPDDGWWATPTETIRLASLEFGRNSTNLSNATARFVVPEAEAGIYDLMLCTTDCSQPLADVVPLQGIYVGDAATVHALRNAEPAIERLLGQLQGVSTELGHLRSETQTIDSGLTDVDETLAALNMSMQRLSADLAALETRVDDGEGAGGQPWWILAGGFLAGSAVVGVFALVIQRRRPVDRDGTSKHAEERPRVPSEERAQSAPDLVTFDLQ